MRIAILLDQLNEGGVQRIALREAKELLRRGHAVELFVLFRTGREETLRELEGVPWHALNESMPWFLRRPIRIPPFRFLTTLHLLGPHVVGRNFPAPRFDILLCHGTTAGFTAQVINKFTHLPYVLFVYDPMTYIFEKIYRRGLLRALAIPVRRLIRRLERKLLRDASGILTLSIHIDHLTSQGARRVTPLSPGVDPLENVPQRRGDFLLAFSRWEPAKQPTLLLDLAEKLPEARFVIAGTWSDRREREAFREDLVRRRLESRVELRPNVNEDEKRTLFREARAWVHPHVEAFGLAGLEAAATGCPIIMPAGSGLATLFEDGVHGFFPPQASPETFVEAVRTLANDERLAWRLGKAAWERSKGFSWQEHIRKLEEMLRTDSSRLDLLAIEIGHITGTSIAGGDRVLAGMAPHFPPSVTTEVIITSQAAWHWEQLGAVVTVLPPSSLDRGTGPIPVFLNYLSRVWRITRMLRHRQPPAVVYSSTNILPDVFPAFFARRRWPTSRWIARVHHLIPPPWRREGRTIVNIVSWLMHLTSIALIRWRADAVIALNRTLRDELQRLGVRPDRIHVIGAGVDVERIRVASQKRSRRGYDGVFLGRLHQTKGIFDLIDVWRTVRQTRPTAKLGIIGSGPPEVRMVLETKIKQSGLSDGIDVLGFLPEDDLFPTLAASKVFLFVDHEAGWGIAIAEAMACGLPVVGYDLSIFGDVFRRGFMTAPLRDVQTFANRVIELLSDDDRRRTLRREAFEQAEMLDWRVAAEQFTGLLHSGR